MGMSSNAGVSNGVVALGNDGIALTTSNPTAVTYFDGSYPHVTLRKNDRANNSVANEDNSRPQVGDEAFIANGHNVVTVSEVK